MRYTACTHKLTGSQLVILTVVALRLFFVWLRKQCLQFMDPLTYAFVQNLRNALMPIVWYLVFRRAISVGKRVGNLLESLYMAQTHFCVLYAVARASHSVIVDWDFIRDAALL